LLFGLAPAIHVARPDLVEAMKGIGRTSTGAVRARLRKVLVVSQVAFSTVLLVAAGLLARSLMHLWDVDAGFRPEHVLTLHVELADRADADASRAPRFFSDLMQRVDELPGVQAAGMINNLPLTERVADADFYRDDQPVPEPGRMPDAQQAAVMAGYFRAMGIPLLRGRLLTEADGVMPRIPRDMKSLMAFFQAAEFKVVINEAMARQFWPGEDPIGKTFHYGPPSFHGPKVTIVGIVGNSRQIGLEQPPSPQFFMSAHQYPMPDGRVVIKTSGDPVALAGTVRSIVTQLDPYAVVSKISTMESIISQSLSGRTNNAVLLVVFSGLALLLAALGLYGTMAYMVAQRTQEFGIRMAVGAAGSEIQRSVMREGAVLTAAGLAIGFAVSVSLARFVAGILYGITSFDAVTYGAAMLVLGAITLAASYIPARRASHIDPMDALRVE
jgi:predicted permease